MSDVFAQGQLVTLPEMLAAREALVQQQRTLLQQGIQTVISFKLNIPGPIKQNAALDRIFDYYLAQLQRVLTQAKLPFGLATKANVATGSYALLTVAADPLVVKRQTCLLEQMDPLARLCDFDVLYLKDQQVHSVHRTRLGLKPRTCLLCGQEAKLCARSRTHSVAEMQVKISQLYDQFLKQNKGCA
ncbi:citrate lyase holo-[acyl-carrier protein] synthase [Agrilactobacillus fermenti]|uniref:citrate lyase holo-[acyl-carrier protein] synthase n=1 Tax=Agrilactobacillus fermenti TaxID=2586909 RepID=UPI001E34F150|nr:citrate lyase holo-[acyl-carrier protein] synthase [Agrilactobacillus fermenti]MCD2257081.1 citrate lyase holo-[acyl-carrier protein] synthase [Agrilactobacillus fermenti]